MCVETVKIQSNGPNNNAERELCAAISDVQLKCSPNQLEYNLTKETSARI
jgi:hypothetical protein